MQGQQQIQRRNGAKEWSECVVPSQLAMLYEQQQSAYGIGRAEQAASITNSISFSSMEAGIVPDNTIAAARVLRYKEKRQARKFEKTIRYATRKAYLKRPWINGRFAKRSDVELEVDHMSSPPDIPQ
ncbi:hypothetical protein BAE44_0012214 [Dichanthelium oligosanthes]|uniref:CCT domain-containing protein n=1 Tax=Dichanthelium oligosanthes TaxID=888268 RepID=A0A1E5VNR8_9POAL|nr:hypothetical protein BAE44_0012214 [Dichanthelium oligosanthes]